MNAAAVYVNVAPFNTVKVRSGEIESAAAPTIGTAQIDEARPVDCAAREVQAAAINGTDRIDRPLLKLMAPNVLNTTPAATVNVTDELGIVRLFTEVEISSVTV